MRDPPLLDEIIRLRKLHLETNLSSIVEEAAQLLARERQAEALPFLDLCIEYADEPQRSAALRLREECAAAALAAPPAPA